MAKPRSGKRAFESPITLSGKPLTGILLEPIEAANFAMLPATGDVMIDAKLADFREKAVADASRQRIDRIVALMAHYEVSPDSDWQSALLLKLARDFIPGFQVNVEPKANHRPPGTFTIGGLSLFDAVQARISKGEDIKQACTNLSRAKGQWHGHSPKALATAYHRVVKKTKEARDELDKHPIYGPLIKLIGVKAFWESVNKRHLERKYS